MLTRRTVIVSPAVVTRDVGGEAILLNQDTETYLGLDEVGARIWQLLREDGDVSRAFGVILAEYAVDAAQLEADFDRLLDEMIDAGIIAVRADDKP